MSDIARTIMLQRIRRAVGEAAPAAVRAPLPLTPPPPHHEVVEQFAERVADYRAIVERVDKAGLIAAIGAAIARHNVARPLVPPDLPQPWIDALPAGRIVDHSALSSADLDAGDGVVTACRLGVAVTGTIVLDHGAAQGRRALTLIPDVHICVVRAEQVVPDLPDAIALLHDAAAARRPLTFISGPSATSDIELSRVEGVHGPRTLHVLLVG